MASWRIGYMVIPEALTVAVRKAQDTILICPPVISQQAAVGALDAGPRVLPAEDRRAWPRCGTWCSTSWTAVRSFCTIPPALGAFYFLLRVDTPLDSMTRRRAAGARVRRGGDSRARRSASSTGCYLRVAYGALDADTIAEGIGRLVRGLTDDREEDKLDANRRLPARHRLGRQAGQPRARRRDARRRHDRARRAGRAARDVRHRLQHARRPRSPSRPGGPTQQFLAKLARRARQLRAGRRRHARPPTRMGRNEAIVFGPEGEALARYCKLHPFSLRRRERSTTRRAKGSRFSSGTISAWRRSCATTCGFPKSFARRSARGAELLVVIANWPQARESHWLALLRARAIENQAYVVGVNRVGSDPNVALRRTQPDPRPARARPWPRGARAADPHGRHRAGAAGRISPAISGPGRHAARLFCRVKFALKRHPEVG